MAKRETAPKAAKAPKAKVAAEELPPFKGRLCKLSVKNFRAIGNPGVEIDLDDIVVLVGPNNCGKSSILKAYEVIMQDGSAAGHLKLEDFPHSKIEAASSPEIELLTEVVEGEPGAKWIEVKGGKKYVRERWIWTATGPGKRSGWNVEIGGWDEAEVPWGAANVANSRRPQPHAVRAFDPPDKQAEQIHDLLKTAVVEHAKTLKDDQGNPLYASLMDAVKTFQEKAVDGATAKIDDIEERLNEIIAAIFLDHEVEYRQPTETTDKTITLFPVAGRLLMGPKEGHKSGVEYQGSGTRRTLLWAALKILSEEKSTSTRPHVLLIDEPELCLHPNAVRDACKVLYDLAEKSGWQVMLTTHSPVFIDLARDNTSIIRVARAASTINSVSLFRPTVAALGTDDKENLKLLNIYDPYVAEFFFGGRVVVVEGDTEYSAFKYVCGLYPAEFPEVHIVRARGKATIVSLAKILNHFGTTYAILHDSDPKTTSRTKDGKVQEIVNPAWTINSSILAVVKGALDAKAVRLVASVPNFEKAYFDQTASGEKPYSAIQHLKADAEKLATVKALLAALIDHSKPLPKGAHDWSDIKVLEDALATAAAVIPEIA
jgi:putative ATP-dependent endonuclease of OLD family